MDARPRGTPLTDEDKQRVAELHGQGLCRNDIARLIDRSPASVSKIAAALGLSFDRSKVVQATVAKQADNRSRRAQIAVDLLDDLYKIRQRAFEPYRVVVGTKDGAELIELPQPPLREVRDAFAAMGTCVDKHKVLVDMDPDSADDVAKSMLGDLAKALGVAAQAFKGVP